VRKRLIVGNWKMHKTATEARTLVHRLADLVSSTEGIEVVLAPPFTALHAAGETSRSRPFALAAQNLFWEDQGAFTGEVSAPMLKDLGCQYAILGHSERRQLFGEQDEAINRKLRAALRHGLRPILCVGESLLERDTGRTFQAVTEQLLKGLAEVSREDLDLVTVAYEPVWAIGTGRAASPAQAAEVHRALRGALAETCGREAEVRVRILYGGSVTAENASALFGEPEVDGALVGGACLDPYSFAKIIASAVSWAGRS
jgi:triosephosphate isomerase